MNNEINTLFNALLGSYSDVASDIKKLKRGYLKQKLYNSVLSIAVLYILVKQNGNACTVSRGDEKEVEDK